MKGSTTMKKIISLLMSIALPFCVGAEAFAAYTEEHTRSYETGGCAVTYTVRNEWDNYRQINMAIAKLNYIALNHLHGYILTNRQM